MADIRKLFSEHISIVFEDSEIDKLAKIAELIDCEMGELLFEADDPGDSVYLVGSGAVDLFTIVNSDVEQTLLSVREGGFVGILALIEDSVRDINARVSQRAELYKFEKDNLSQIISDGGQLGHQSGRDCADTA